MTQESSPTRRGHGALLLAAIVGTSFAFFAYDLVAGLARSPGDWLWNGAISANEQERATIGGPLLDLLMLAADAGTWAAEKQRILGLASTLAILVFAVVAARKRESRVLTAVPILASIGLLVLCLSDPSEVLAQTQLLVPAVIAVLSVVPFGRAWRPIAAGVLAGALTPLLCGAGTAVSPTLGFACFAAGTLTLASNSRMTGLVGAGLFGASAFAVASLLQIEAPVQAQHWWSDAALGLEPIESWVATDWLLAHGLTLALVGIGLTLFLYDTSLAAVLALGTTVFVFVLAAGAARTLQVHHRQLSRDGAKLEQLATTRTFRIVPHAILNIPMHARPQLIAHAGGLRALAIHDHLTMLDFGSSIYIPIDWQDLDESRPVLRWTPNGCEATTFGHLLDLESVPLVGVLVAETAPALATDLRSRFAAGSVQSAFGQAVAFVPDATLTAEEEGTTTVVRRTGTEAARIVVALDPSRRARVGPEFLQRARARTAPGRVAVSPTGALTEVTNVPGFGIAGTIERGITEIRVQGRVD